MPSYKGNKIEVSEFDTLDTLGEKIAFQLKELPKFIYLPSDIDLKDPDYEIVPQTIIQFIQETKDWTSSIKQRFPVKDEDIIYMYFKSRDYQNSDEMIKFSQEQDLNDYLQILSITPPKSYSNFYSTYDAKYKRDLTDFLKSVKSIIDRLKLFDKIKGVPATNFELNKVTSEIKLDLKDSISETVELFDQIQLNKYIPFCSFGNYYKVQKDFKFFGNEWDSSLDTHIIMRILNTENVPKLYSERMFSLAFLTVSRKDSNENQNEYVCTVNIRIDTNYKLNKENIIDRILSVFPVKYNVISDIQESINGVFYIPKFHMNKYVMLDLIMNDPLVSSYLYSDEHAKATKVKSGIHFYFNESSLQKRVSANMTLQYANPFDREISRKSRALFPFNEYYIRVKIQRATNEQDVQRLIMFVSKIMAIYLKEEKSIIREYQKFIPNFEERKTVQKIERKSRLKDIAPDLFVPKYSKKCTKKRQPNIVDSLFENMEIKQGEYLFENIDQYDQVMLYPKTSDEGTQHFYGCPNSDNPYVGLVPNVLTNKYIYPYLPCCYPMDQKNSKKWKTYFQGQAEVKTKSKAATQCLKSNKVIKDTECGILPMYINNLFELLDLSINHKYYRMGVSSSNNSFLECLKKALNRPQMKNIKTMREEIANGNLTGARQELYDMTPEQIREYILDMDNYFDPKMFIRLAEEYFDCVIYLFTRSRKFPYGMIQLPRHLDPYIKYKTQADKDVVFIYEHTGTENVLLEYPRCEIIIQKDTSGDFISSFKSQYPLVHAFERFYDGYFQQYKINGGIKEVKPPSSDLDIVCQGIDSYGKTRLLTMKLESGKKVYGLIDPIPPLFLPEDCTYSDNNEKDVYQLIEEQNMIFDQSLEYTDKIVAYKDELEITFPIGLSKKSSKLQQFNYYNRVSRYLEEYTYFMYSKFLNERKSTPSDANIIEFIDNRITIKPDHIYEKHEDSRSYIQGNKLILVSEDLKTHISFALRRMSLYQTAKLVNYHKKNNVQKYYIDTTDFKQYLDTVIINGKSFLNTWFQDANTAYALHTFPQLKLQKMNIPYFMSINGNIYIIQPAKSIEHAIGICDTWDNGDGYNSYQSPEIQSKSCIGYLFHSLDNIQIVDSTENEKDSNRNVLIFKLEGTLYYAAMLSS